MGSLRAVRSVVVLDDDDETLEDYQLALRPRTVFATHEVALARDIVRHEQIDLALIDLWLGVQPTSSVESSKRQIPAWGIDAIRNLRIEHPTLTIVLITAGYAQAFRRLARDAGANGTLPKMLGPTRIVSIVESEALDSEPKNEGPMSLARNEYEYLCETYVESGCNASKTARDLAIPRSSVYRKLRRPAPRR